MRNNREKDGAFSGALRVTFPALMGALSLLMLYLACTIPAGRWGWVAVAGLGPLAVVASMDVGRGIRCWTGTTILAFLLLPDKFCAVLFTALFGLYPMVKALAERIRMKLVQYIVKLAFFNLSLTAIFGAMGTLVMASLPGFLGGWPWQFLYIVGNVVFLIYDLGLTRLIPFYLVRVDRAIRKSGR